MTISEAKQKLISWATAQLGTRESGDNWNKYAEDPRLVRLYGWSLQNQPWCDLFTDEAFVDCFGLETGAAMTYQRIGAGSAACRQSAQFFKDNGAFVQIPEPGDVVFFYYDGVINHQGIVTGVDGSRVSTVEATALTPSPRAAIRSARPTSPAMGGRNGRLPPERARKRPEVRKSPRPSRSTAAAWRGSPCSPRVMSARPWPHSKPRCIITSMRSVPPASTETSALRPLQP